MLFPLVVGLLEVSPAKKPSVENRLPNCDFCFWATSKVDLMLEKRSLGKAGLLAMLMVSGAANVEKRRRRASSWLTSWWWIVMLEGSINRIYEIRKEHLFIDDFLMLHLVNRGIDFQANDWSSFWYLVKSAKRDSQFDYWGKMFRLLLIKGWAMVIGLIEGKNGVSFEE